MPLSVTWELKLLHRRQGFLRSWARTPLNSAQKPSSSPAGSSMGAARGCGGRQPPNHSGSLEVQSNGKQLHLRGFAPLRKHSYSYAWFPTCFPYTLFRNLQNHPQWKNGATPSHPYIHIHIHIYIHMHTHIHIHIPIHIHVHTHLHLHLHLHIHIHIHTHLRPCAVPL